MQRFLTRTLLGVVAAVPCMAGDGQDVLVSFSGDAHDIAYDAVRSRAYVTLPQEQKLAVVDTNNWVVTQEIDVAPTPQGVALSLDGSQLFVAKRGSGSVAVFDPDTWSQSEIFLTNELGDARTYDVIEGQPGRLYVSSNPSSNGFAWIVQVELDNGNAATRVASNNIIRCAPTFERSRDMTSLYVGACFSPNSLYKLDLTQPNAPIVAEDDHGSVSGTSHVETNPDGSRVFLASGQIVETGGLSVIGQIGSGLSRFDEDPTRIFVYNNNRIQTWNVNTQTQVDEFVLPCQLSGFARELLVLPGETGFLVLSGSSLCGRADLAPCEISVATNCNSLPNSTGVAARLLGSGEPRISQNLFSLELEEAPPGEWSAFLFSSSAAQLPFGDGILCLSPFEGIQRLPELQAIDANGRSTQPLDFTSGALANGPIAAYSTWYFQAWYRDHQNAGTGVNTSSAVEVLFCP